MANTIILLYNLIPKPFRNMLGKAKFLKPIRDAFLRNGSSFKEVSSKVNRQYGNQKVNFKFYGSVKVAAQAKSKGIENTLLKNSIKLLEQHFNLENIVGIDIGANFGYLTMVWSQTVCANKGQLIAFEANPYIFSSLEKTIKNSGVNSKVKAVNKALSNKNGLIDLYLTGATSNVLKGTSKKQNYTVETYKIESVKLDDYLIDNPVNNCHFIKIDVDGIELEILKGAEKSIDKFRPIVIVETNNDKKIIDFFIQKKYTLLNMKLNTFDIETELPLNVFCVPNSL